MKAIEEIKYGGRNSGKQHEIIKKQQSQIEQLQKENEELKGRLIDNLSKANYVIDSKDERIKQLLNKQN